MNDGFYTALGTPLDPRGDLIEDSFRRQVSDQIAAGSAGLLALGSMGHQPGIKTGECPKVARACVEAAAGACAVLVGVMDNSCHRVLSRIDALKHLKVDGVVATTPYYIPPRQEDLVSFYRTIADRSPLPLYLYDLPGITKTSIEIPTAEALMGHPNIHGIKTGVLRTARSLLHSPAQNGSFHILFSELDLLDLGYAWGLRKCLDGIFSALPEIARSFANALRTEDMEALRKSQDTLSAVRDRLQGLGIFRAYSELMNLQGYEGNFAPDYAPPLSDEERNVVKSVADGAMPQ